MNEVLIFTFKYISPVFLLAILLWRFKGKFDWIFPSIIIVVVGFNFSQSLAFPDSKHRTNKLKDEIISLAKMNKNELMETMDRRGVEVKNAKDGTLIYPADKRGDYSKYYLLENIRFIIAFDEPDKYDSFCASVDSLMIKKQKIKGCPKDTVYRLTSDCFVCKDGYDSTRDRYILKVSRSSDFTLPPDSKSPKSKSSNNTHNTPNPFNPPIEVMRPPKRRGEYKPNAVDSVIDAFNGRLENKRLKKAGGEEDGG